MNPCNTALVLVVRQQAKGLERALRSVRGTLGPGRDITKLFIVDTTNDQGSFISDFARQRIGNGRRNCELPIAVLRLPGASPAAARNAAFRRFLHVPTMVMRGDTGATIDQVFCLNADDECQNLDNYARDMRRLFRRYDYDIIVPHWLMEVDGQNRDVVSRRRLKIPQSYADIDGWVALARVGTVFGYSSRILQMTAGFSLSWEHDEWVDFIGRALMCGAKVGYAESSLAVKETTVYVKNDARNASQQAQQNDAADHLRAIFAGQVLLRTEPQFAT